jgi:hypothetical protein
LKIFGTIIGDVNMTENSGINNGEFTQKIKDLRIAVEQSVEKLKKLEKTGTESDAIDTLWTVSAIWNGKEYSEIETALKARGHKSGMQESLEKLGAI